MNISHVILYAIVPIIVVMLAGYISGKKGVFTGQDAKKFNKVVLDYALPAALFVSIVQASREMLVKDTPRPHPLLHPLPLHPLWVSCSVS